MTCFRLIPGWANIPPEVWGMKGLSDEYVASVIRKAVSAKLTTRQAAARLGVTRQYVNRLKKACSEGGATALRHGNEGRAPAWKTDKATEGAVVALYRGKYAGFNFSHFREKLLEEEGIGIGYRPPRRILTEAGIRSPKGRRKGRKARPGHPSGQRRERFGELLQIDASIHRWFGPGLPRAALHGAIDDATGTVMGLWFDREETLSGYCEMAWQILTKYGIPEAFYGDNRSIFGHGRAAGRGKATDRDARTGFRRMRRQLCIEPVATSVSQAKGRGERLRGTLQSRLVSEPRLRGIATIEEANRFLPSFTAGFNRRFPARPDMERSLFAPAPAPREIDFCLSAEFRRVADNGCSLGFDGSRNQLVDEETGEVKEVPPGTEVRVYVTRSGKRIAAFGGRIWGLVEAGRRKMEPRPKKPGRPRYVPGPDHPWRRYVLKAAKG